MSKNSSAKYYQDNKERQKKLVKDMKVFSKKKKIKSNNMVIKDTKIYPLKKNRSCNHFHNI